MNNEMIKITRKKIELNMSELLCEKSYIDRGIINEYLIKVETTLDKLNNFFNDATENLNLLLGGEFNPIKKIWGSFDEKGIPLYLELDILKVILEKRYLGKVDLNERVSKIVDKIENLRNKATNLSFNETFKPNEPLCDFALENIVRASGNMSLTIEKTEEMEYLAVVVTEISEDVEYKNGDCYSRGVSYNDSEAIPLYQKDFDKIIALEQEKSKRNYDRMIQIVGKYFKNNSIVFYDEFEEQLIDKTLDDRIKYYLSSLCLMYSDIENAKKLANHRECKTLLYQIEDVEKQIKLEQEKEAQLQIEKKESAIKEARDRYKSKNFLWKLIHKKTNPEKQNFEEMTISEIETLYRGRQK